tara:strand:+ start:145 stop:540 length:396 start_codon:yes stop_codon:yes gene_type:complete
MHLDELLSKEIEIDFETNLTIRESKIKSIIHKWPDQIYDIIIMMQKDRSLKHYVFQLPDTSGVLEFNLNRKTKKIDINFYNKNDLKNQRKFKSLLGEVYADILEEQALEHMNYTIYDKQLNDDISKLLDDY